ncbi:hypothetical protein [Spirosoma rhododendri]|uniref:Uncharacterized protein n=1 Tax=Spirosoma rhododendri TaxID=2728024 RepID=A0A7L5DQU0_9BACT|nr:hypothetical protein [Spirosoma rhododendri]QJD79593.1 hypothetical protein HH216_15085 [Spirosoma rhododendri]
MFQTSIGPYDGNSWESLIQICLKHKYADERYRRMDATVHGDLGIEGYTLSGRVFQCYCPDDDTTTADLTDKQKDKINKDLSKLVKNEHDLKSHLMDNKIKDWILITPEYRNKDIHAYCNKKATEYRDKKLSILHDDFFVHVHELDDYAAQIPIALKHLQFKLDIKESIDITSEYISDWKDAEISYTQNAIRKYGSVLPPNKPNREIKIESLTNHCVKNYLLGSDILRQWETRLPEKYESFVRLISSFEHSVATKCMISDENPNILYRDINNDLKVVLEQEFPELSKTMINTISDQVVSKWMLECHIDFE